MEFRCLGICERECLPLLEAGTARFEKSVGRPVELTSCRDVQSFLRQAVEPWDALLIALPGAEGMETVITARRQNERVPLVWISDDEVFGVQSYRLHASMFLCLPVSEEDVAHALKRCDEAWSHTQRFGHCLPRVGFL